jgi:hypothetical protein
VYEGSVSIIFLTIYVEHRSKSYCQIYSGKMWLFYRYCGKNFAR